MRPFVSSDTSHHFEQRHFMTQKPSSSNAHNVDKEHIGARLRHHRKAKKLTLKQVSEMSGVALSTLSKMELGQATVSYDKLEAAARSIGLGLTALFTSEDTNPSVTGRISKSTGKNIPVGYTTQNYQYRPMFSDYPHQTMMPLFGTISAKETSEYGDFHRHIGEEFLLVLSGSLRIVFENGEELRLAEKESAYFDSSIGHIYLSEGPQDAEVVSVMYDPRNKA